MANIALIIAGGRGNRMGQDIPKQFLSVHDKPIIMYTCEAFQTCASIDAIYIVCIAGWQTTMRAYANQFNISKLKGIVEGGNNGQESIRNGIREIAAEFNDDDIVLVHDGIRPLVPQELIEEFLQPTNAFGSAITCTPCAEALLQVEPDDSSKASVDRDSVKRTQTPQGFPLHVLKEMHSQAVGAGITNSVASCTLAIELGRSVHFCRGSEKNIKLTTVDDVDIFKALLEARRADWLKR